ncbi:hypothetical protein GCM10028824_33730 [Hymenobacter segetis]
MAAVGGTGGHDGAAIYSRFVEVIELFEGEGDYGEFDEAGWVEVLLGVKVVGMGGEGGVVLGVAVNLGIDDLKLVLGISGNSL